MAAPFWTKEQNIVVLEQYFNLPFSKVTGKLPEVIRTAELIGRTPDAVKMKINNFGSLDPKLIKKGNSALKNTTKLDRAVWDEYSNNLAQLAQESARLVQRFALESGVAVLVESQREKDEERKGLDQIQLYKRRVNQDFFRRIILKIYDNKCCITGLSCPEILNASHILPWSKYPEQRLKHENGLCLNTLHDRAFDRGLITVDPDYKVRLSKDLLKNKNDETFDVNFGIYEGAVIRMPEQYHPDKEFLKEHNSEIFRG